MKTHVFILMQILIIIINKLLSKRNKLCFFCLVFSVYLSAQNGGSHKYIIFEQDSCRPINTDVLEVDNRYYMLTDLMLLYHQRKRIPTVTVFDESLNIIEKIELFDSSVKIMPTQWFYKSNFFYMTGLCDSNGKGKPFFIKFDKNFNIAQPLTLYFSEDIFDYAWCHSIINQNNEFVSLVYNSVNCRLLNFDTNGNILQDFTIPNYTSKASIAETDKYYLIDYHSNYLLKFNKYPLLLIDTLYPIVHKNDIPERSLIAIHNQLIRTNTYYKPAYDKCEDFQSYDLERSVLFLDTNMNTNARLEFGNPCWEDSKPYLLSLNYINPDSIYYTYETKYDESSVYQGNTISIANFSQNGHLNFNYTLKIPEDTSPKFIYGCRAVSDGGVLVFGESLNYIAGTDHKGFLLKYHPQKKYSEIKETSVNIDIKVFPNPAQTQFTITNTENANITLYTILGQKIKQVVGKDENTIIQTGNLPVGMYILKIEKENNVLTKKIQIIK